MSAPGPYLSVVATTRNDDHGKNLLGRTQAFVNCLLGQCRRHGLDAELILVEWNPPPDRPPLVDVLRWPGDRSACPVRIIRVPPQIHYSRYRYGDALPLYQMIGKNVGIRRARGQFILSTNIDILFSDELAAFLASRTLHPGTMYRIDRHDVASDVPVEASVDEQLDYCLRNRIRLNAREGTFPLTPDGLRALFHPDIAAPEDGILFGRGWFPAETDGRRPLRWLGQEAELLVRAGSPDRETTLHLDVEPGPGANRKPCALSLCNSAGVELGRSLVGHRSAVSFQLPPPKAALESYLLRAEGDADWQGRGPRTLNLRINQCGWREPGHIRPPRSRLVDLASRLWNGQPFRVPYSRWVARNALHLDVDETSIILHLPPPRSGGRRDPAQERAAMPAAFDQKGPVLLHLNGCGDFTLLHRERWFDLRGYPELDRFSMNIDSLLCWEAFYSGIREEVLEEPMRIYHIEHEAGSGWTPEGEQKMYARFAAKGISWLDYPAVLAIARHMHAYQAPVIFNGSRWGLRDDVLSESHPAPF